MKSKSSFCCIIFSFNRAMQLDLSLRSFLDHIVTPGIEYTVIWQCTPDHETSYKTLISEWEQQGIRFKRCDNRFRSAWELRCFLLNPGNLYRCMRKPQLRRRFDNFKELVEETIREAKAPFTFFSTDDQYVFKPTCIPEAALSRISSEPENTSFRMGMDEHLQGNRRLPEQMATERIPFEYNDIRGELIQWDADDPNTTKLWEYSFNVDFQVFDSNALLRFLSPILYHIPTTLEWAGLRVARKKKKFRTLIGTTEKTVIGMQLNLAQTMVCNQAASFSLDTLKDLYEKGFRLIITDEQLSDADWLFMPNALYFMHPDHPSERFEYTEISN